MHKQENQCSELGEETMNILDNNVLVNLFVSTQMNNLDLSIRRGIQLVFYLIFFRNIYFQHLYRLAWRTGSYLMFLKRWY